MTTYAVTVTVPEGADHERAGETVELTVDEDGYVLAAAREAGLWLPADCQQGWCCTCAARIESGTVDQSDSRRYFDVDRAAGFALPCTGTPDSDLELVSHQYDTMLAHRAAHDLPPGSAKRE